MPLLDEYRKLSDSAIDGFQDWLSRIGQIVDKTIVINSWTEEQLRGIEQRDSSFRAYFAPINKIVNQVFHLPRPFFSTEAEVREAFFGLTGKVQEDIIKVLAQSQMQRGVLVEMQGILDNIALIALGDRGKLQKGKMSQKSYWKWILRSYKHKMMDFDDKMEMSAAFYANTEQALKVIATTQLKMQQIRGELIVFRDALQEAPLQLENGKSVSLQLYIDILKAGVSNLEKTSKATKLLKQDKMKRLEVSLRGDDESHK